MDESRSNERPGAIIVSIIIAIRFIAAPLFLYTFANDLTAWALCIFLVAVLTDALDGQVARRLGGASPFLGPYSDAVADFFLVLAAFSAFVLKELYPLWILLLIVVMFAQFVLTSRLAQPIYDPVEFRHNNSKSESDNMVGQFSWNLSYAIARHSRRRLTTPATATMVDV